MKLCLCYQVQLLETEAAKRLLTVFEIESEF
jgi:hypothetical protein